MFPEHIQTLLIVFVVAWVLFRWGGPIFLAHALFYFWTEQWGFAALALAFAYFFTCASAIGLAILRFTGPTRSSRD